MVRYDKYKDSDIEWIGKIPEHWKISRYRYFYFSNMGATLLKKEVKKDGKYPVYSATETDVIFGYVDEAAVILNEGDIVIPARGNSIGHIKVVNSPSTSTQTTIYSKKIKKNIETNFVKYYLQGLRKYLFQFDKTAIPQITVNQVKNNTLIVPPFQEQTAIATYLDHKTIQIDELIAKKERLLELYEEEKTAIINQAVTKGIKPDVPMKDSGIDWLGEIPEHWDVKRVDRVVKIIRGNTGFKKDELLDNGKYVALQYGKTYKVDEINNSFNFFVNDEFYKSNQIVQYDDVILISTSETLEDLGHSCFYARKDLGLLGGEQILLRPKNSLVSGKYLYYSSKIFSVQLRKFARGIKVFRFNTDNLKEMYTIVPPLEEQTAIAQYIEREINRINVKSEKTKKLIELLKEYKQALISDVVTGKIKVV